MASDQINVSKTDIEKLVSSHDGDTALLYLFKLENPSSDLNHAALCLCRTMKEMLSAEEKLTRLGLSFGATDESINSDDQGGCSAKVLPPADEMPVYTSEDISARVKTDDIFKALVQESQQIMGHALSTNDFRILFGAYDYLGLSGDVLMLLLNYTAEKFRDKYGESRRPTAKAIEKEAFRWHNDNIETYEQAEAYIRQQKERQSLESVIKNTLQIYSRNLTATESRYINSWISLGFREDAIEIAYDRTITNTGSLTWPYMDKIIKSWYSKKLITANDIESHDGKKRDSSSPTDTSGSNSSISREQISNIVNFI